MCGQEFTKRNNAARHVGKQHGISQSPSSYIERIDPPPSSSSGDDATADDAEEAAASVPDRNGTASSKLNGSSSGEVGAGALKKPSNATSPDSDVLTVGAAVFRA